MEAIMKKTVFYLIAIFFLFQTVLLEAYEIKGVQLPETVKVDNVNLVLNGAGVRMKFFFSIYVGALYLPEKTHSAEKVIKSDIPKRIVMHFVYSHTISKDKIIDAFKDDFENNSKELMPEIKPDVEKFYSFFDKDINKDDEVLITYLPSKGTCVEINKELKGCIKNKDFMTAIFSVWFGEDPPSEGLKDNMLGKD
jgi:hypothetical protein